MNSEQLNAWAATKFNGDNKAPRIAQLQTGTMPAGQGSTLAPVNLTNDEAFNLNAVPFVDGGYPQHIAPPNTPGRQHLRVAPTAQVAPWVSVPACAAARPPVKKEPIGLVGNHLSLPSPKPRGFTVRAWTT